MDGFLQHIASWIPHKPEKYWVSIMREIVSPCILIMITLIMGLFPMRMLRFAFSERLHLTLVSLILDAVRYLHSSRASSAATSEWHANTKSFRSWSRKPHPEPWLAWRWLKCPSPDASSSSNLATDTAWQNRTNSSDKWTMMQIWASADADPFRRKGHPRSCRSL